MSLKRNGSFKTLLKAEIIWIIIFLLFILYVFAVKNEFISCLIDKQKATGTISIHILGSQETHKSAIYRLMINRMSRQVLMSITLLIKYQFG
jgi:hypothetical protein